jgi:hypothetical protein
MSRHAGNVNRLNFLTRKIRKIDVFIITENRRF